MTALFESAIKEVMDTGILSLPTRKKIWLSMGEIDFESEKHTTNLNEGCKKRIELAKGCVKKVLPEWDKIRPEDDRPKKILKLVDNCLKGKVSLSEIELQTKSFSDEMQIMIDNNPSEIAYEVSMAAIYVSYFLFHDDPLLQEDDDIECLDNELDPDMWDSSYEAYRVYINTDEVENEEMKKVKGIEFWLWYIEQAGKISKFKDINTYIKPFRKKVKELLIESQINKKEIPKEVTLENFVKYMDDNYQYDNLEYIENDVRIMACAIRESVNCIYCNTPSSRVKFTYNTKMEIPFLSEKNRKVYLIQTNRKFFCDNSKCDEETFGEKTKLLEVVLANCKRYLSDPKRKSEIEKLLFDNSLLE